MACGRSWFFPGVWVMFRGELMVGKEKDNSSDGASFRGTEDEGM